MITTPTTKTIDIRLTVPHGLDREDINRIEGVAHCWGNLLGALNHVFDDDTGDQIFDALRNHWKFTQDNIRTPVADELGENPDLEEEDKKAAQNIDARLASLLEEIGYRFGIV